MRKVLGLPKPDPFVGGTDPGPEPYIIEPK
jgi:hypothetical protein